MTRFLARSVTVQIQGIMHAFLWGVGPRVEEACVDHITGFSYSAPYEDLKLEAGK